MSTRTVHVVDYGVGNLYSICRAVEVSGGHAQLVGNPDELRQAGRIILPGVGAFGDGMEGLAESGLADAVIERAAGGTPLLGICLGMQMLMESSEEFDIHAGLGLLRGHVRPIPSKDIDGTPHKIPHIGWSTLREPAVGRWTGTILDETVPDSTAYFVHSFAAEPDDPEDVLATTEYGGQRLAAAVSRGAVFGCQFHPERSGPVGLRIIERFLAL